MPFAILEGIPLGNLSVYEVVLGFEQNTMARQCTVTRRILGEHSVGISTTPIWVSRARIFKTELAAVANARVLMQDRIVDLQKTLGVVRLHEVQLRGLEPKQVSSWERLVSEEDDPDELPLPEPEPEEEPEYDEEPFPAVHDSTPRHPLAPVAVRLGVIHPWDGSVPADDPRHASPSEEHDGDNFWMNDI